MTKDQILNLIYERPVEIAHWLGRDKMTDIHNEWLRSFLFQKENQTLQAHRGSYKSTTLALAFAIHTLIFPNETVIYMRKTDDAVANICREAQRYLKSGAFQTMAQIIYGHELILTKDSSSQIDTNLRTTNSGQSQICGYGINASITGQHADLVITDDIITQKDRVSKAERDHTALIYQELQNVKNRDGRFINCGTPWHKDDAFSLMTKTGTFSQIDCYSSGLMTPDEIQTKREEMVPSLFAANYELKHIADENALFKEEDTQWLEQNESDRIENGVAHIDAAYDGSDYTAYTIIKKEDDHFIGYGKIWQKHVDKCLPEIILLHEKFKAGSLSCETNGDKGYLAKQLRQYSLQVKEYHEHQNKYLKIATHLYKNYKKIYWINETDPDYIQQILGYTEDASHDDAPDSAASLLRSMEKDIKVNTGRYLMGGF